MLTDERQREQQEEHGNMTIPQALCVCVSQSQWLELLAAGMKARDSKVDKMCVYMQWCVCERDTACSIPSGLVSYLKKDQTY